MALARRLAVIMHRIWVDGTEFRWTRKSLLHESQAGSNLTGEHLNSTERWDHVPRGTMDEVSSSVRLDLPLKSDGKAALQIVPPRLRIPCWKGRGADSEEKHEPASDIDTVVVDSLKALDPERPIREANC